MKKIWKKPELIILYRPQPEESVLLVCKTGTATPGTGPQNGYAICMQPQAHKCGTYCVNNAIS